jgi:hypothetical protein
MRRSIALCLLMFAASCACKKAPVAPATTTTTAVEKEPATPPEPVPPPEPPPPPESQPIAGAGQPAGSGVLACDEYIGVLTQMETACVDKMPRDAIDAMKQGRDAMLQSMPDWSSMDEATRTSTQQTMNDACAQARDALRQASASLGCPV